MKRLQLTLTGLLFTLVTLSSHAVIIRVAQESSAGAGDFDANVLGYVDPFSTTLSIADFYQYGSPNFASYNGNANGGPDYIEDTTQGFFVQAADGLHYVVVHDIASDDEPTSFADMATVLIGGRGGPIGFSVEDDPSDGTAQADVGDDRVFSTSHGWADCCTDGFAIGGLVRALVRNGEIIMYASFTDMPTNISEWQTTGNLEADIAMTIATGRRVEYSVPEPLVLSLLAVGIAGVIGTRRRRLE